jgi:hypothetical protein
MVIMPATDVAQNVGTGQWVAANYPAPGSPTDNLYRLTQLYYIGSYTQPPVSPSDAPYAFMTDCSAGTAAVYTPIPWPKKAPELGLVLTNFHNEVTLNEPFYVDVNFVLEIQSTNNELPKEDDMALFGQINYHPDRTTTETGTPYIDLESNPPKRVAQPSLAFNYGGAPINILYNDLSSNRFPVIKIKPQYAGELIYRTSNKSPVSLSVEGGGGIPNTPSGDISGAVYSVPIHWRAKCFIPDPDAYGVAGNINWNGWNASNMQPTINSSIYVAFTMFNTQAQYLLNTRSFNYNIVLESTSNTPYPPGQVNLNPLGPGNNTVNWGYERWQSGKGFCPNISISTIKQ